MTMKLHGDKKDPFAKHSYGKRFPPNPHEVANCLVTAVARIIFSRASDDTSPYLYMDEKEALNFQMKTDAKLAKNRTRDGAPVRVRANGPHNRFAVHFKRGIQQMEKIKPNRFGIAKLCTLYCQKRTAYRRLKRLHNLQQEDVNGRAGQL
jgi:hypothetical protein